MKTLLLDGKKFNLFMERMDKKMTINEIQEKMLLVESWWDDIVKAARGVSNSLSDSAKNMPVIRVDDLPALNKSIDEFADVGGNISKGIKNNLSDIKKIKGIIGADAFTNLKSKWKTLVGNMVQSFGLGDDATTEIIKFIGDEVSDLSETTLKSLSDTQIESLVNFRNKNINLVGQIDDLEKLVSFASKLGDNPTVVDLLGSMSEAGAVKSLDDFAKEFDELDTILKNSPDGDVAQLWESILKKSNLEGMTGTEAVKKLKQSLGNDASYITTTKSWRKNITSYLANKIFGKVEDLNFQINKLGIDPELTVVYKGHDGSLEIITCQNKRQLDSLVKHLEAGGMSPRILDEKGILISDLTPSKGGGVTADEISKGIKKTNFYYVKMTVGLLAGAALTYIGICYMRADKEYSSEKWDDILAGSTEEEQKEWEERGLVSQVLGCVKENARQLTIAVLDEGLDLYNKNVAPEMAAIEGGVNKFLDLQCGRTDHSRVNMVPVAPCTHCLECTEENVKSWIGEIKIGGSDMSTVHSDIMDEIDPMVIFPELNPSQAKSHMKSIIKKIKKDEKYGKISQFLTKDGQPMDIASMVQVLCRKHNKYCIADLFAKTVNEFFPPPTMTDCGEIEEYMTNKLNVILKMEDQLSWGKETDSSIDISSVGEDEGILKGTSSVKSVIDALTIEKDTLVGICQNKVREKLENQHSSDLTIDLSNMMDEMWESGESNLGCNTSIRKNLTMARKTIMRSSLVGRLMEITENKQYKNLLHGLDTHSEAWEKSFNTWWDRQRKACNMENEGKEIE